MLYQAQPLSTECIDGDVDGQFNFGASLGISDERQTQLLNALKDHARACVEPRGFNGKKYMLESNVDLQTPAEAVFMGVALEKTIRMITETNPLKMLAATLAQMQ